MLLKDELKAIKAKLSGDAKGGAILLGLRGVVLIGHGATSVEAVKNGTLAAAEAVRADLVQNVADSMEGILRNRSSTRPRIRQRLPVAFNLPYRSG